MRASARHQRGQTIVIALLVLLLLAFVGGLFATIVTRNLVNAGRSNRVQSADYYAEAGTRFANDQLTASLDGADWRPPLQYALAPTVYPANNPGGTATPYTQEQKRYNAAVTALTLVSAPAQDPDKAYLDQGFTRYNIGGGRYLLRVTYDPVGLSSQDNQTAAGVSTIGTPYSDPRARYVKIESVGREGTIDSQDPTTYTNATKTQLNATLVQYKAIGITDYARFETNPENRSDIMALGVSSSQDTNGNIVTPGVFDFNIPAGATMPAMPPLAQYPITTIYGALNAYKTSGSGLVPDPNAGSGTVATTDVPGGGSIRVNGSARFFGANTVYLNNAQAPTPKMGNTNMNIAGLFGETVEVAGNLLLDNYNPANPLSKSLSATSMANQDAALQAFVNTDAIGNANFVYPSNDQTPTTNVNRFSTFGGAVRDGNSGNDAQGQPRSVNRLEPPTLDTVNPVTNLTRYAAATETSSQRLDQSTLVAASDTGTAYTQNPTGKPVSQYGYGQSIYVDNTNDVQKESSSIVGGYTLLDEWLHRAGANDIGSKSGWVANFYRPPGVDIVVGRQQVTLNSNATGTTATNVSFYGVRMTRSDVDGSGTIIGWKNPDGTPIDGVNNDGTTQSTMTVSYKSLSASNDPTAAVPSSGTQAYTAYNANPNNDVVIYAEGNVRVHGVVSADPGNGAGGTDPGDLNAPTTYAGTTGSTTDDDHLPRHITIVTNGTAYIDGSLLRGNPQSSITVLAHDYVCINTTQFLAGPIVDQNPSGTNPPGAFTGDPSLRALDFSASDEVLLQEFGLAGANPHLYISGGASSAGATAADFDIINPRTGYSLGGATQSPFTGITGYTGTTQAVPFYATFSSTGTGTGQSGLFHTTFDLSSTSINTGGVQSDLYQLAVRRDQGVDQAGNVLGTAQDFLLERAAILPMDIRIEAVLFAQTRSFFVIPGDWFNSDSTDTVDKYDYMKTTRSSGLIAPTVDQDRYPFYGQPIDMKIVIDGSVSEARPADITAQSAWMAKWGWIPQFHGGLVTGNSVGTVENSGHPSAAANTPGVGLQIVYNPLGGFPYYTDHYLRTDIFGRPLPYAPKLPVCTGLLYAGQNTGESILQ